MGVCKSPLGLERVDFGRGGEGEEVEGIVNNGKKKFLPWPRWAAVVVLVLLLWVTDLGQRGD